MRHFLAPRNLVLTGALGVLALGVYYILLPECTTIGAVRAQAGSQGYRTWSGESLKSFTHSGNKVCVPLGWEPLGESAAGDGWVEFPDGVTGVLYKTDSFLSSTITPAKSEYSVTILYPKELSPLDVETHTDVVESAFNNVGALYGDSPKEIRQQHTVLVTAGLAGDTRTSETRIYPDPTLQRSFIVRNPGDLRSEELLVHAVMHLYNRHALSGTEYKALQQPFSEEEFEELEATWAEFALNTNVEGARLRLLYLYQVHTAVMTKNFELIPGPPFNDETGFGLLRPTLFVPQNGSYLEHQYGHYILAPLVMAATDGLLQQSRSAKTVQDLLTEVHTTNANFMSLVERELGATRATEILSYARGEVQVPFQLIESAKRVYLK
jgi:hypothetical protein